MPLAVVEGVEWVAMSKDEWRPEMARFGWTNGLDGCADWLDTAERVQALDLLVTVDTAIAHVAGGLGVPVWILLAAIPDFRWGLTGTTTPWYRSATLYRQEKVGDWRPVLERVAADLQREVHARQFQEAV